MNSDTPWNVRMKVLWPMWWPWVACPAFFKWLSMTFWFVVWNIFQRVFSTTNQLSIPWILLTPRYDLQDLPMLGLKIERFYLSFWRGSKICVFVGFIPLVWSVVPSKGLTPACWTPWIDPRHSDTGVCLLLGAKGLLHMTRRIFNR